MRRVGHVDREIKLYTAHWSEYQKEKAFLENIGVDGRTLLK